MSLFEVIYDDDEAIAWLAANHPKIGDLEPAPGFTQRVWQAMKERGAGKYEGFPGKYEVIDQDGIDRLHEIAKLMTG